MNFDYFVFYKLSIFYIVKIPLYTFFLGGGVLTDLVHFVSFKVSFFFFIFFLHPALLISVVFDPGCRLFVASSVSRWLLLGTGAAGVGPAAILLMITAGFPRYWHCWDLPAFGVFVVWSARRRRWLAFWLSSYVRLVLLTIAVGLPRYWHFWDLPAVSA